MITITYIATGNAVSDFELEKRYNNILKYISETSWDAELQYATDNIFYRILLGVVKGEIDYKKIQFRFKGENISINQYGVYSPQPKGFLDLHQELAENIICTATVKRVKNRTPEEKLRESFRNSYACKNCAKEYNLIINSNPINIGICPICGGTPKYLIIRRVTED